MVRARQTGFWILMAVLLISGSFLFSCGKTEIKSEGGISASPPVSDQDEAEKAKKRARIREQETTDQEMREKALKEEEARRLKMAAEKAQFETEDVLFEFDQYVISDSAKQVLNKKAKWLKEYANARVQIEGHCDERGSTEYNLALGQRRADSAMQYLVSLGISANRLSTISFGKEKPLDQGSSESAWSKNRRAHFILK
jgi:peptidoglycan-associated lipoprotein